MGIFDQENISSVSQVEKDRLFETVHKTEDSSRNYFKILGIVGLCVLVIGAVVYYLTLPGVGSRIIGPKGLEDEMRGHFRDKQKRTATDITFFNCEGFLWARVDVEVRPDIPGNPLYAVSRYRAKAVPRDAVWDITASPITSPEMDTPCSYQ